jgi:hypothetical protein
VICIGEDAGWNWVERLLIRIPFPYYMVFLAIGLLIYLGYSFFNNYIGFLEVNWDFERSRAMTISASFAFLLITAQYLLLKAKRIFFELDFLSGGGGQGDLYKSLREGFVHGRIYYLLVVLVILPFLLIDSTSFEPIHLQDIFANIFKTYYIAVSMMEEIDPFNDLSIIILSISYDIYRLAIGLGQLFLLAITIWLLLSITWALYDASNNPLMKANEISIHTVHARLSNIRGYNLRIAVFLFLSISLSVFSFSSSQIFEILFLVVLLALGMILFVVGLWAIRLILRDRLNKELEKIDEQIRVYLSDLFAIVDHKEKGEATDEQLAGDLNRISVVLEILGKQREELRKINTQGYNLSTLITFLGTFTLSLVSLLENANKLASLLLKGWLLPGNLTLINNSTQIDIDSLMHVLPSVISHLSLWILNHWI